MLDQGNHNSARGSKSRRNDDFKFWVSTGRSNLGQVTNKQISLRKFRDKLAEPLEDSAISFADYQKLSPDEKAERKKVAGFVMAATFKDGKRKSANQNDRTLLTYDMDFITIEQLENLRSGMAPICAFHWMMHTTRSHCPEKPRVRIFVFLSRPVNPEEYYALDPSRGLYAGRYGRRGHRDSRSGQLQIQPTDVLAVDLARPGILVR